MRELQNNIHEFQDFYTFSPQKRSGILLTAIERTHTYHFKRNTAYRISVSSKGISETISDEEIVRLLRPTSQVFKSYIDIMGTAFPHHKPEAFIGWMEQNLSISLPNNAVKLKNSYPSLEDFLKFIEVSNSHLGLEIGTSSGTTGRATIMVHDRQTADRAAEAYQHAVYSLWGTLNQHQFIFVMPSETRIVMARIARSATERLGMVDQSHFTIPFSATPDQVRIRSGRLFEPGVKGWIEQRILHPFMGWMNDNYVKSKYVNSTIDLLEKMSETKANVLLFGGYIQLHHIYQGLQERGFNPGGDQLAFGQQSMI
nr:hypothetical protein [Fodinibius sp.]